MYNSGIMDIFYKLNIFEINVEMFNTYCEIKHLFLCNKEGKAVGVGAGQI